MFADPPPITVDTEVLAAYAEVRRNIIASADLFAKWIVGHPFNFESDRFGLKEILWWVLGWKWEMGTFYFNCNE